MSEKQSSFVKYTKPVSTKDQTPKPASSTAGGINIPGCRISLQNNQLLTSIGIPSIDYYIGGGLPVGSVCLIGEDTFNYYADIICRCFIAEGVLNKHGLFIANPYPESNSQLKHIPNVANTKELEEESKEDVKDSSKLRIAWRYSDNLATNTSPSTTTKAENNYFLLNKYMSESDLNGCDVDTFKFVNNNQESSDGNTTFYQKLAQDMHNLIDLKYNITKLKKFTNILRIVINGVGGAYWNDRAYETGSSFELYRFLLFLRQQLRHSLAVCLVTVQNDLIGDAGFLSRIEHLSDYVFVIDNCETTTSRLAKTQYEGLFRINKLPRLNSLNSYLPETLDLAFYVKRKRFVVEVLHLPPDITEDDDEKKGRTSTAVLACASKGPSKFDF